MLSPNEKVFLLSILAAVEVSGNQSPDATVSEGQETVEVMEGMERLELTREEEESGGGGGDEDNIRESSQTTTPQEEEQPQLTGTFAVLPVLKF